MEFLPKKGRIEKAMKKVGLSKKKELSEIIDVTESNITNATVHLKPATYQKVALRMSVHYGLNYLWFYADEEMLRVTNFKNSNSEVIEMLRQEVKLLNNLVKTLEKSNLTLEKSIESLQKDKASKFKLYQQIKCIFDQLHDSTEADSLSDSASPPNTVEEEAMLYKKMNAKAKLDFAFQHLLSEG